MSDERNRELSSVWILQAFAVESLRDSGFLRRDGAKRPIVFISSPRGEVLPSVQTAYREGLEPSDWHMTAVFLLVRAGLEYFSRIR